MSKKRIKKQSSKPRTFSASGQTVTGALKNTVTTSAASEISVNPLQPTQDENGIYGSTLEWTYNAANAPTELLNTIFANVTKLYEETNNNLVVSLTGLVPNPQSYKLTLEEFYALIKHEIPLILEKFVEHTPETWLVHAGGDKIVCPIFDTEEDYEDRKKSKTSQQSLDINNDGNPQMVEAYDMDLFAGTLDFGIENIQLLGDFVGGWTERQLFNWYMFYSNTSTRSKYIDDIYVDNFSYRNPIPRKDFSKYMTFVNELDFKYTMNSVETSKPDWLVIDPYDISLSGLPSAITNQVTSHPNPYTDLFESYQTKYNKIIENHKTLDQLYNYFIKSKKNLEQYTVNIDLISYFVNQQIHPEYVLNYPEQYKAQLEERVMQWEGLEMSELLKPSLHKTYISKFYSSFQGAEINDILSNFKDYTCIAVGVPWGKQYANNHFAVKIDTVNDDEESDRYEETILVKYNQYFPYQETIKKYLYFLRSLSIDVSDILVTDEYVSLQSPVSSYQPNSEHIDDPKKMSLMSNVIYPELYFQKMTFTSKYSKIIYLLVDLSEFKNYTLTVEMR